MDEIEYKINDIDKAARFVLEHSTSRYIAFKADMGMGKTTLINAILKILNSINIGNSPTFGIVNEHQNAQSITIAYHFDFYRLKSEEEVLDLGLEHYLTQDETFCFFEWPEKVANLLPLDTCWILIEEVSRTKRRLSVVR